MTPPSLSQNPVYLAAQRQIDLANAQMSIATQNLVNQSTPGYTRQMVKPDFQSTLKSLLDSGNIQGLTTLKPTFTKDTTSIEVNDSGNNVHPAEELMNIRHAELIQGVAIQAINLQLEQLHAASKLPT